MTQGGIAVLIEEEEPVLLKLDEIEVGERVRRDMGDLEGLAESIERVGLLHPVVVKSDGTLVVGHRRIEAARLLGWSEIPTTIIDVADLLSAERDENEIRKDFTVSERVAIAQAVEADIGNRQGERTDTLHGWPRPPQIAGDGKTPPRPWPTRRQAQYAARMFFRSDRLSAREER